MQGTSDPITADDLAVCLDARARPRDRRHPPHAHRWTTWYRYLYADVRAVSATQRMVDQPRARRADMPGICGTCTSPRSASTTPRAEAFPPTDGFLHFHFLPLLGLPLGELWQLDALALADCAAAGTYDAFFTSAPTNMPNGVASPPNANRRPLTARPQTGVSKPAMSLVC